MTGPEPDKPWQLQHPPEMWLKILQTALADLRANRQDQEALQAVMDANEALQVYDQAESASPLERITSGAREGVKGLAQAGADVGRGLKQLITHPVDTMAEVIPNLVDAPERLYEGMTSGDPREIARTVGHMGLAAAPFGKTGSGRTLAGATGEAVAAPGKAVGELVRRPALKNRLLEEQTRRTALSEEALQQLIDQRLAQAGPRQAILEGQAARAPIMTEQAGQRSTLLGQQMERGAPTLENLELRNELMRRKLEGSEEALAPSASTSIEMVDRPTAVRDFISEAMARSQATDPIAQALERAAKPKGKKKTD